MDMGPGWRDKKSHWATSGKWSLDLGIFWGLCQAPPPLLLAQVHSVFMILTGTGRLILSPVSARCVLMRLRLLVLYCLSVRRVKQKASLCISAEQQSFVLALDQSWAQDTIIVAVTKGLGRRCAYKCTRGVTTISHSAISNNVKVRLGFFFFIVSIH